MIASTQANRVRIGKLGRDMPGRLQSQGAGQLKRPSGCLALGLLLLFTLPPLSFAQQLQPSALQQIQTLMAEKAARTPVQRKLDSHLLMAIKRRRGDALFQALPPYAQASG